MGQDNMNDSHDYNNNDDSFLQKGGFNLDANDREEDMFNLDVVSLKPILESKKGVLMMKVRGAQFDWEELLGYGAGVPKS